MIPMTSETNDKTQERRAQILGEENLEKLSTEELESLLRELQEIEKEKRGGQAGGAG